MTTRASNATLTHAPRLGRGVVGSSVAVGATVGACDDFVGTAVASAVGTAVGSADGTGSGVGASVPQSFSYHLTVSSSLHGLITSTSPSPSTSIPRSPNG